MRGLIFYPEIKLKVTYLIKGKRKQKEVENSLREMWWREEQNYLSIQNGGKKSTVNGTRTKGLVIVQNYKLNQQKY